MEIGGLGTLKKSSLGDKRVRAETFSHQLDFLTALIMTYTMPNTINTEMIAGPNGISQPPTCEFPSHYYFYML